MQLKYRVKFKNDKNLQVSNYVLGGSCPVPCAVIAGVRGDGTGYKPLIPGDDDGLVGVFEAQVEGMQVFKRVEGLHTFVMNAPETIAVILEFLEKGRVKGDEK